MDSMENHVNQRKSMEIHENLLKSMKIPENLWESMKIYEIHEHLWDILVSEKEDGLYAIF